LLARRRYTGSIWTCSQASSVQRQRSGRTEHVGENCFIPVHPVSRIAVSGALDDDTDVHVHTRTRFQPPQASSALLPKCPETRSSRPLTGAPFCALLASLRFSVWSVESVGSSKPLPGIVHTRYRAQGRIDAPVRPGRKAPPHGSGATWTGIPHPYLPPMSLLCRVKMPLSRREVHVHARQN